MDVALDWEQYHPQIAAVNKKLRDKSGNTICRRHDNFILDCIIYGVAFSDWEKMSLSSNTIAEKQGYCQVIIDEIIALCTNGTKVSKVNAFFTLKSDAKRRKETTKELVGACAVKIWQHYLERLKGC